MYSDHCVTISAIPTSWLQYKVARRQFNLVSFNVQSMTINDLMLNQTKIANRKMQNLILL